VDRVAGGETRNPIHDIRYKIMIRVKICGITNLNDALSAAQAGAWALGFVFHRKSPRYVSPSKARKIIEQLPPFVTPVGVFVNQKEGAVKEICKFTHINTLQLHGDEDPTYCSRFKDQKIIKAFRVSDDFDFNAITKYKVNVYLFDTQVVGEFGGTGKVFNWNLLKHMQIQKPYILSGGLNPTNVLQALNAVTPFGVDASSGLESAPGIKDKRQVQALIDAVNFHK
jgi:phosphoribosylanthranilate isomerase